MVKEILKTDAGGINLFRPGLIAQEIYILGRSKGGRGPQDNPKTL